MKLKISFGLLFALSLWGCTPQVVYTEAAAVIINQSNKVVKSVLYRACKQESREWILIPGAEVNIGGAFKLALAHDCVDLQVLASDGQLLGRQSGVKRGVPFQWILK